MQPNPFRTPAECAAVSVDHAIAAAPTINDALDKGERVFSVPPGLADALRALLKAQGWGVELGAKAADRTTIVVLDPPTVPCERADSQARND